MSEIGIAAEPAAGSSLEDDGPVLITYDVPGGAVVAWCDRCRKWHHHGTGDGHRMAHCGHRGGYTDYELRTRGPAPREILQDLKRRNPRGPAAGCF